MKMPCNSDYLAASGQELESRRVCKLIEYIYPFIGKEVPHWVHKASDDYYGNVNRLDEATALLDAACRSLNDEEREKIIYDAHNKTARKLASWFERHQEWNERRVAEEEKTRKKIIAKERALRKLTTEEIEALDLKVN